MKKEFLIKPLRLAQQKRISAALAKVDVNVFNDENTLLKVYDKMMAEHYDDLVYCIGVLLTENARNEPSAELRALSFPGGNPCIQPKLAGSLSRADKTSLFCANKLPAKRSIRIENVKKTGRFIVLK